MSVAISWLSVYKPVIRVTAARVGDSNSRSPTRAVRKAILVHTRGSRAQKGSHLITGL